ncbi:MAG: hypothetical protein KTR29_03345 [Rhodothermaceae bacterium]|nr:hypothetical protein [Rhodothermaceae bacterium]
MEDFKEINEYPNSFSGTTTLVRLTEGIGFRYSWGTEGITDSDLSYTPGNESRTMKETLDHIRYLALFIANSLEGERTTFPEPASELSFTEIKKDTLGKLNQIRSFLASTTDEELAGKQIKIAVDGASFETPIWHLINGPFLDMGYHVGQLIMMRRSNGNPIDPAVEPFFCKKMG